jgi:transcriptional regulator with XRE-family HTH domain
MPSTKERSLRQLAKELGVSPAYLSYMVNGKRPWREDLYERYCDLVNTSVNTGQESVNTTRTDLATKPRARSARRLVWDQEVGSSILPAPTKFLNTHYNSLVSLLAQN